MPTPIGAGETPKGREEQIIESRTAKQINSQGCALNSAIKLFLNFLWKIIGREAAGEAAFTNRKSKKALVHSISKKFAELIQEPETQKLVKKAADDLLENFTENQLNDLKHLVSKAPNLASFLLRIDFKDFVPTVQKLLEDAVSVDKRTINEIQDGRILKTHTFPHQIILPTKSGKLVESETMTIEKKTEGMYLLKLKAGSKMLEHPVKLGDFPSDDQIKKAVLEARDAWLKEGVDV